MFSTRLHPSSVYLPLQPCIVAVRVRAFIPPPDLQEKKPPRPLSANSMFHSPLTTPPLPGSQHYSTPSPTPRYLTLTVTLFLLSKHLAVHHGRPLAFFAPPTSSGRPSPFSSPPLPSICVKTLAARGLSLSPTPKDTLRQEGQHGFSFTSWHASPASPRPTSLRLLKQIQGSEFNLAKR